MKRAICLWSDHHFETEIIRRTKRDNTKHLYCPAAAAAAKSLQSCPTLWGPRDGGPPGFPVPGILQARTLEWVATSFSNRWKWKVKVKSLSLVRLLATPWTAAHQVPLSMGFSRQECWRGVPLPSPIIMFIKVKTKTKIKKRILNDFNLLKIHYSIWIFFPPLLAFFGPLKKSGAPNRIY